MKALVVFRGGVGDFFLWLTRAQALLRLHEEDHVTLAIVSKWPEAIRAWAWRMLPRKFDDVVELQPYGRPVPRSATWDALVGHDVVYHWDVWLGARGTPAKDHPMQPVDRWFPRLALDPYPRLDIQGDGVGGTVLQVEGISVGAVQEPAWWAEGARALPPPVRVLGRPEGSPGAYGAEGVVSDPLAIYAAIKSASRLVGVDSGCRNIALTTRTPVLEIETPWEGMPDYDVFVPPWYRDRWRLVLPGSPLSVLARGAW